MGRVVGGLSFVDNFVKHSAGWWADTVQRCAEESDCFVKHQPGMAGLGWLGLGRTIL